MNHSQKWFYIQHYSTQDNISHILSYQLINTEKHQKNSSQCRVSRVKHEYLHTLRTCVSFSWVQTISSSTVKTLKYCVMLSSAVFLTSCTSWLSLQNRVWTGSLCQRANEPWSLFLSPVPAVSSKGPLKTHLVSFDTTNMANIAGPNSEATLDRWCMHLVECFKSLKTHSWLFTLNQHFKPYSHLICSWLLVQFLLLQSFMLSFWTHIK